MVLSHLIATESVIGVDIGSSSIKIMYAEPTKQGARIAKVAMCPTPPESIREGIVVNVPEVAGAIQFAIRSAGLKVSNAIAAIAGPGVIVRQVLFPKMPEQALRKSIHFEAAKYISASIEDSVVEFDILGDADEEGQMRVMLVAAPKAMVESRVIAMEQAGLDPLAIDIEALALVRSLIDYNSNESMVNGTVALLDMGASHTEINIVQKGSLELTRTIPIAGSSVTNAIKSAENCSGEEAEQKKYVLDLNEDPSLAGAQESPGLRVVRSLVDELLREIRRSINYHQSQLPEGSPESTVDSLILTGGLSRLKGLAEYAGSRLNMNVKTGNPALAELIGSSMADSGLSGDDIPLFAVAFGLAVKEMTVNADIMQSPIAA